VLLAFHKPYGVLSQFTPEPGSKWRTLAEFGLPKGVYAIGRLDADSEGLLLFSDEPGLNSRLLDPEHGHRREYWAQVEGIPDAPTLARLEKGIDLGDYRTRPARARLLDEAPALPPREPPIRFRKTVPDCWLSLELTEGKNRQVRRMTAAVGHPTLRLVRVRIGKFQLGDLATGNSRELTAVERQAVFESAPR
jgi:23S rRNA pseudouridine2457 synthase